MRLWHHYFVEIVAYVESGWRSVELGGGSIVVDDGRC